MNQKIKNNNFLIQTFLISFFIICSCESNNSIKKNENKNKNEKKEYILKSLPKGKIIKNNDLKNEFRVWFDTIYHQKLKMKNTNLNLLVREYSYDTTINKTNCSFIYKSYSNISSKHYNDKLLLELNDFIYTMVSNTSKIDTNNFFIIHIDSVIFSSEKSLNYIDFIHSSTGGAGNTGCSIKYKIPINKFFNYKESIDKTAWKQIEKYTLSSRLW